MVNLVSERRLFSVKDTALLRIIITTTTNKININISINLLYIIVPFFPLCFEFC